MADVPPYPPPPLYAHLIASLRKQKVPAFLPGERDYELSVATANLLYRFTRPDCVAQPETAGEVEAVVRLARQHGVPVTIKSGGHSYAGFSTTDRGILLDLKRMNEVEIQLDEKGNPVTVTIQAGAKWGDVYRALVHGRHDGFVINGGRCPSVGVGGFILGGGLGPFTRSVGMGSDTLLEAVVVTVKGDEGVEYRNKGDEVERVRVTAEDDPSSDHGRLFWALRGGGGGSFGVVTEIKMAVKELKNKKVVAGRYTWNPLKVDDALDKEKKEALLKEKKEALIATMNGFYTAHWAPELTIDSNWIRDIKDGKDSLGIRFTIYYDGTTEEFEKAIDQNIKDEALAKELKRRAMPEDSTRFFYESLVLMWEEESRNSLPRPGDNSYQLYNSFVFLNTSEDIKNITAIVQAEQDAYAELFKTDTCTLSVTFIHTGGNVSDIPETATAYRWRSAVYHAYVTFLWKDKWVEKQARGFLATLKTKLRPFSINTHAAFINFADATLEKGTHELAYYGENLLELRQVKKIWDPTNFFAYPQGINLPEETPKLEVKTSQMMATTSSMARADVPAVTTTGQTSTPLPGEANLLDDKALKKYEKLLTDKIAKEAWRSFTPPVTDYVNIY